jgi:small subunit ribosomal protein S7
MRRAKSINRVIPPDVRYNNVTIQTLIHHMFTRGKKSTATSVMYDAMDIIKERSGGKDPVEVFENALKNVAPVMEVRPRRVGGATYQVPMEVPPSRRTTLAHPVGTGFSQGAHRKILCRQVG